MTHHKIYRPFTAGRFDPVGEWVFDCSDCGGLSWHLSRSDAFAFGCEITTCGGHGIQHVPRCGACGALDSDCNCATMGFGAINTL